MDSLIAEMTFPYSDWESETSSAMCCNLLPDFWWTWWRSAIWAEWRIKDAFAMCMEWKPLELPVVTKSMVGTMFGGWIKLRFTFIPAIWLFTSYCHCLFCFHHYLSLQWGRLHDKKDCGCCPINMYIPTSPGSYLKQCGKYTYTIFNKTDHESEPELQFP